MSVRFLSALLIGFVLMPGLCSAQQSRNLIDNSGFERQKAGRADGWEPYDKGYALDRAVRHSGTAAVHCVNANGTDRRGASVDLKLNQSAPTPLVITGWSRARNVDGSPNGDYALYVDLEYTDGTPLWGQIAPFATGTHDWQRKQLLIFPNKPIRSARVYALFRGHAGEVWFDDISARELSGNGMFDSQPIAPPKLKPGETGGWFVRDVAAGSPIVPLVDDAGKQTDASAKMGLEVSRESFGPGFVPGVLVLNAADMAWPVRIPVDRDTNLTLLEKSDKPRALTVYYVEQFDASDVVWWNDIRQSLPVAKSREYANLTRIGAGATGSQSLYPFGCVTGGGKGLALGVPPTQAACVSRIGYNSGAKLLFVAFDIGPTPLNEPHADNGVPTRVPLGIVRYPVNPQWGFRHAAEIYYHMFWEVFSRRATAEGIWIPFTAPENVQKVGDFGIAYHEGDNSVASDDKLGILSFRYTEPMTYWMPMDPKVPRTYDAAVAQLKQEAAGTDAEKKKWAQAVLNSGSLDENGHFNVEFQNAPWANGAVWTLNPNPRLPAAPDSWTKSRLNYTRETADRTYGKDAKGVQDGEYLDSIEGWADTLDYRPESLKHARSVPTFNTDTYRPAIPTWFSVYEEAASMRDDLHRRGKLLMANSTPWRIWAFSTVLDVMGTETNWLPGGKWMPDSDAVFNLRRTLCYRKPYLLLQNTDFQKFGTPEVEKYFQRSLFYGVFPSMFSVDAASHPYWEEPNWYNRDRPLFKKYIPIIQKLSAAGWAPITFARSDNPRVYVERFGTGYLTLLNDSSASAKATIKLDRRLLPGDNAAGPLKLTDLISGALFNAVKSGMGVEFTVTLQPEQVLALQIGPLPAAPLRPEMR